MSIRRRRTTVKLSEAETSNSDDHSPPLSSASTVAANDDLLTEILLRLPIRPVIRFKSVSKHWLSLINHPQFSPLRNTSNPNHVSGVLLHRASRPDNPEFDFLPLDGEDLNSPKPKPPFRSLSFINDPLGVRILQSCNGLLCCCRYQCSESDRIYYICNPTTKQFTTLPQIGGGVSRFVYGVYLAFDPSKSLHYKVVCVRSSELVPDHFQFEIYSSSETGHWRVSGEPFSLDIFQGFERGVYWNGAINWFDIYENSLYFNVDQVRWERMPAPPEREDLDNEDRDFPYFGESHDHLHLVETTGLHLSQFTVYEMERDYSKWFVKYTVDLSAISMEFPEMISEHDEEADWYYYAINVLLIVRGENNDDDDDSFLMMHIPGGKALRYSFVDRTIKKIDWYHPGDPDFEFPQVEDSLKLGGYSNAFPYMESLSCVYK